MFSLFLLVETLFASKVFPNRQVILVIKSLMCKQFAVNRHQLLSCFIGSEVKS